MKLDTNKKFNYSVGYIFRRFGIVIIFVALCAILGFASENFLTLSNIINILRQSSFYGMLGIAMCIVIITAGIDLSIAATLCLSGVIAAMMSQKADMPLPLIVVFLACAGVGIAIGLLNGLMITKLMVPPFIATLAMSTSIRGVALLISGGSPVTGLTDEFKEIGGGSVFGLPNPIIFWVVTALLVFFILNYTRFGRYVYAIGGNEAAAKTSGLKVASIKTSVYIMAGVISAIAGVVLAARIGSGSPVAAEGYELDAVAGACIGGTSLAGGVGTIQGVIIGILIITVISNGMDILNVSSYYQQIIKGVVIAVAVILDVSNASKG